MPAAGSAAHRRIRRTAAVPVLHNPGRRPTIPLRGKEGRMTITAVRERPRRRTGVEPVTIRPVERDPVRPDLERLDRTRLVLESARVVIERGWLQHGWYVAPQQPRWLGARLLGARSPAIDEIAQACLVAALSVAAHRGGSRPDP